MDNKQGKSGQGSGQGHNAGQGQPQGEANQTSRPMAGKHDRHAEKRHAYKASTIAALKGTTTVEQRLSAFFSKQREYFVGAIAQARDEAKAGTLTLEQFLDELQHEVDVYAAEHSELVHGLANGVGA